GDGSQIEVVVIVAGYNRSMASSVITTAVALSTTPLADVETDLLIVPVFEGESLLKSVPELSDATGGAVDRALTSLEVQGKPYDLFLTPVVGRWRSARIALIGGGPGRQLH